MSGCGPGKARCRAISPLSDRWIGHGEYVRVSINDFFVHHCPRHAAVDMLVEALKATELVLIFGLLEEKADGLRNEIKEALRAAGEVRGE